jgi:hypothetical protein
MKLIFAAFLICFFSSIAVASTTDVASPSNLNEYLSPEKLEEILSKQNPPLDLNKAEWTIETHEGFSYLKGRQESNYGEGKLFFMCTDKGSLMYAFYDAGEYTDSIVQEGIIFSLMTDDNKIFQIPTPVKFFNQNNWVNAVHEMDARIFPQLIKSDKIVYMIRNTKGDKRFRGFTIEITGYEDIVRPYWTHCAQNKK